MAKLGVITDGISTDFEHALKIMSQNNLDQAELQYLWDKEVGDFCAYLCTEAASWIHGQSINQNGGSVMEH